MPEYATHIGTQTLHTRSRQNTSPPPSPVATGETGLLLSCDEHYRTFMFLVLNLGDLIEVMSCAREGRKMFDPIGVIQSALRVILGVRGTGIGPKHRMSGPVLRLDQRMFGRSRALRLDLRELTVEVSQERWIHI